MGENDSKSRQYSTKQPYLVLHLDKNIYPWKNKSNELRHKKKLLRRLNYKFTASEQRICKQKKKAKQL